MTRSPAAASAEPVRALPELPLVEDRPRVALAGNPNVGKTALFNRLTGARAKVGNYPGVTVEVTEGMLALSNTEALLLDVPGTYSLAARSAEELLALQAIAGVAPFPQPHACVVVADATNLTRNLYLALQILELGVPTVLVLNLDDQLAATGQEIGERTLSELLGVPVVRTCATTGRGVDELKRAIERVLAERSTPPAPVWSTSEGPLAADVDAVAAAVPADWARGSESRSRALALWALLSLDGEDELDAPPRLRAAVTERRTLAERDERALDEEIVGGRYAWIDEHAERFLRADPAPPRSITDRIDAVLLHPLAGFPIFLLLMGIVFQSLFSWADPAIGLVETVVGAIGDALRSALPAAWLTDLLVDGIVEGVGAVVVFLPQILLLFLFLGIMEDTGYMARVASLMDRVMRALGLHGRAFVPMLSGFACAVPAILATRTMERRRDRLLTMMVVPLMTCSARLPVYTLLIASLYPPDAADPFAQGGLMVAMYVFSTLIAFAAAALLGRTLLRGPSVPLVLEMPPYRRPHAMSVLRMMWSRSSIFLKEAGSVILVCTVVMWFLLSHPTDGAIEAEYEAARAELASEFAPGDELDAALAELEAQEGGAQLRQSYGGRLGRAIEPVIEPLGYDWTIGVGVLGAFAAREVFVSTMGVVYGLGGEVDEESTTLREKLRAQTREDGSKLFTPLTCLSLMVFFALACQCMSTVAVVKRETRSWTWPSFLLVYMTVLAWVASLIVYQGGKLLGFE